MIVAGLDVAFSNDYMEFFFIENMTPFKIP
jgi:hypothetical protein